MQSPFVNMKRKHWWDGKKFVEMTTPVLALRMSADVIFYDNSAYLMTMAGENLFQLERAYKKVSSFCIKQVNESGILADIDTFESVASSGNNPRKFVSYNKAYGEGFIIVDQSPTAVDIAAIKNTNTKILMRLPEKGDCEAVGNAAGLNEEQVREMSKLGTGIAVVMQNNWLEAVLTHIDAFSNQYERKIPVAEYSSLKKLKGAVIQELMQQYIVDKTMNMDRMMAVIDGVDAVSYKKEEIRCCMRYDNTPKEDRGDTLVPEKSEYLKDPPIAENKNTGERYNDVNYDWPSNGGFEGKPEEVTPQVGDRFDRVGAENGRYVAPIEGDTPQPVENRGLPYHFTEDNITDEPSYHSYEVDRDFGQLQDAINEYNNPALTAEENEFMRGEFQKEYDRNNWPSDEYTHEPGKTYYGDIAEAFDSGGGTQLELPMSVESLKELGMIHEV